MIAAHVEYIVKHDDKIDFKTFENIDGDTIGLAPEMLLNVDEIVYNIVNFRLDEKSKDILRNCKFKDDLYQFHMTFGMSIRNTYGLWELEINPLSEKDPSSGSEMHPDNCSFEIMSLVVKALNNEFTPNVTSDFRKFDQAMQLITDNPEAE